MQIEFERRVQTFDTTEVAAGKMTSDTILSFLNEAIDKFYKTRYSGLNLWKSGFEQTQKRTDDLRNLVKSKTYPLNDKDASTPIEKNGNEYNVTLPSDYTILLGDTAGIVPNTGNPCWPKDSKGDYIVKPVDTLESTIETIDRQKADPLSEYHLKYCTARPLKLIAGDKIYLYTDGNYEVSEYTIKYLSKPAMLTNADLMSTEEYSSFPAHAHMEIVKIAVELYMATKPVQHYSAYAGEVQTME